MQLWSRSRNFLNCFLTFELILCFMCYFFNSFYILLHLKFFLSKGLLILQEIPWCINPVGERCNKNFVKNTNKYVEIMKTFTMKKLHWCKLCNQPDNAISILWTVIICLVYVICFVCMTHPNVSNKEYEECILTICDHQATREKTKTICNHQVTRQKTKTIENVNLRFRWDD